MPSMARRWVGQWEDRQNMKFPYVCIEREAIDFELHFLTLRGGKKKMKCDTV